jgi:hypothetical protein
MQTEYRHVEEQVDEELVEVLASLFVGTCLEILSRLSRPIPPQGLGQLCHVHPQMAEEQNLCLLGLTSTSLVYRVPQFGVPAT